jgi:hypothetical protein
MSLEEEANQLVSKIVAFWRTEYFEPVALNELDVATEQNEADVPEEEIIEEIDAADVNIEVTQSEPVEVPADSEGNADGLAEGTYHLEITSSIDETSQIDEDRLEVASQQEFESVAVSAGEEERRDVIPSASEEGDMESNKDQYDTDSVKEEIDYSELIEEPTVPDASEQVPDISEVHEYSQYAQPDVNSNSGYDYSSPFGDSSIASLPETRRSVYTPEARQSVFLVSEAIAESTESLVVEVPASWNFHTVCVAQRGSSFMFKTTMSRPSMIKPVSPATGSVWFKLTKNAVP